MTTHQLGQHTILSLPVPVDAIIDPVISNGQISYRYQDKQGCVHYAASGVPFLPPGKYKILGRLREISEEVAATVVPMLEHADGFYGYRDYMKLGHYYINSHASLSSWHTSQKIGENDLLILEIR